ncbi:2-keto-3-deoxy-6-phosphogluconate aldolase and 2-dehydro-3-deoxygluconokinase [Lacticaseibacillus paracasei subsp. paracasei Lpp48]|nr:2-keto-3-deoxy-6-phosphogluconate aldolase and 2-dehydro-3-deoxygluconokinase [Lacticaseibacillus paracasei subsp. paracasei Lpp48]
MQKYDFLNRLIATGCVAVVRGDNTQTAIKTCDAVIAGGITGIELTFTVPHANEALETLTENTPVVKMSSSVQEPFLTLLLPDLPSSLVPSLL